MRTEILLIAACAALSACAIPGVNGERSCDPVTMSGQKIMVPASAARVDGDAVYDLTLGAIVMHGAGRAHFPVPALETATFRSVQASAIAGGAGGTVALVGQEELSTFEVLTLAMEPGDTWRRFLKVLSVPHQAIDETAYSLRVAAGAGAIIEQAQIVYDGPADGLLLVCHVDL